jgi:hypothetical protein
VTIECPDQDSSFNLLFFFLSFLTKANDAILAQTEHSRANGAIRKDQSDSAGQENLLDEAAPAKRHSVHTNASATTLAAFYIMLMIFIPC